MKKLTPKQRKIKDIVVITLQVLLVLVAITISAIVIANPVVTTSEVSKGSTKLLPILSNSMEGTAKDNFKKGDLVIAKKPKNVLTLKEGEIITFRGKVEGKDALIIHRIVDVVMDEEAGTAITYITRGDNNPETMIETVNPYNVLAVYSSHLKGVGNAIFWLQTPKNFLLVIVLPLVVLFVYNIIMFVIMLMGAKAQKVGVDEDEIRRKAVEEYLANQKDEDKTDTTE